jgi:Flp pilus assembly protein TadG
MTTRRKRANKRRGSVMIEFTLSFMFLVPLFLGLWEFGRTFYLYSELENAVRAGARYASQRQYDSANATPTAEFLTAVQNMTVYGTPTPNDTSAPIIPGLTPDNVNLQVTFTSGSPSAVAVSIINYSIPTYVGNTQLHGKPLVWCPFLGTFGPP